MTPSDPRRAAAPKPDAPVEDPISSAMIQHRRNSYHYQWWYPDTDSEQAQCHCESLSSWSVSACSVIVASEHMHGSTDRLRRCPSTYVVSLDSSQCDRYKSVPIRRMCAAPWRSCTGSKLWHQTTKRRFAMRLPQGADSLLPAIPGGVVLNEPCLCRFHISLSVVRYHHSVKLPSIE